MIDETLLVALAFAVGACVGSFLNVVIYRVPRGLSIADPPRSFCPSCKTMIPASRNLPLVSWLWLNGRCGSCQATIPFRYFGVELATALVFAVLAWREVSESGDVSRATLLRLGVVCFAASLCVAITVIDFQLAIIPDPLTIPWLPLLVGCVAIDPLLLRGRWLDPAAGGGPNELAFALAGIAIGAFPALFLDFLRRDRKADLVDGEPESALPQPDETFSLLAETRAFFLPVILPAAIGAVACTFALRGVDFAAHPRLAAAVASTAGVGGGLLVIYLIRFVFSLAFRREAMGLGDAKFLALAGALLGAEGTVLVFAIACFLGALPAFAQLILKLPGPTFVLMAAAAAPLLVVAPLAAAGSREIALVVGLVFPVIALLWFLRLLRRSTVDLTAMAFGPFLAVGALILLAAYEPIADLLASRLFNAPR